MDPGFRVVTEEVDFGRVLEGESALRPVTVQNTTRVDLDIALFIGTPFSAPATVFVAGGSEFTFLVEFRAAEFPALGSLLLSANGGDRAVPVHGIGVRPPSCIPSAPCRLSRYQLETDQCEEGPAPEGSACQTDSVCLEKGECRTGQCVGVPRSCGDNDACTIDSCAPTQGCVHVMRTCPAPTAACRVATCDSTTGCGEAVAPDFMICGGVDCVQGSFCVNGGCVVVPTPEGFRCANATPCQGPGACHNQACERPDAGVLTAELTVPLLGHAPAGGAQLVASAGNVYTVLCGPYAAAVDGGTDGGVDGGSDGGSDGGDDAGQTEACVLASWTGSGFDRYQTPSADGGERQLAGVSSSQALLSSDGWVESFRPSTGAPLWQDAFVGRCGPGGIAHEASGAVWLLARDGGSATLTRLGLADGGPALEAPVPAPAELLAIDELGQLWVFAPERGWLGRFVSEDGGVRLAESLDLADAGQPALSTASGAVGFGARWLLRPLTDGGRVLDEWRAFNDAGQALEWLPRDALLSANVGAALHRRCEAFTSCVDFDKATYVVLFDLTTGTERWAAKVLPASLSGRLVEVMLGRAAVTVPPVSVDFVATVVRADFDAGTQSYLEVFADGARVVLCPFPDGTALEAATFESGRLFTLAHRGDGGLFFETWDMKGAPLSTTGWPRQSGLSDLRLSR